MPKTQNYGIHFPFTCESHEKTFVDLDADSQRAMQSDIMHVIFTPKNQRIRNPEFGSDLIKLMNSSLLNAFSEEDYSDVLAIFKRIIERLENIEKGGEG